VSQRAFVNKVGLIYHAFSIAGQSSELQSDPLGSPIEDTGRGQPN
jgi:hypothetical protein